MTGIRFALAVVLSAVVLVPVLVPAAAVFHAKSPAEPGRLASLAVNSIGLAAGAVLVAVPAGVLLALAVEKTRVPFARLLRAAVAVGLFVPLPVYAVAWQTILARWLPPLALSPGEVSWRPWERGLFPAILVHGFAAIPWVTWITTAALRTTDRGLEDDALLAGGPRAVFVRVLLPRAATAAALAAAWTAATAWTEIPVTDLMMVRTFAEEVYTQLVIGGPAAVAGAAAVAVPVWVVAILVGGRIVARFGPRLAPPAESAPARETQSWWPATVFAWVVVAVFAGLPAVSLVRAAAGSPAILGNVVRVHGGTLAGSLAAAVVVGGFAATLALIACRSAVGSGWFARFLFAAVIIAWLTPGPLAGLGLKACIGGLVDAEAAAGWDLQFPPLRSALYDQPSPLPGMWAALVRFFSIAVVVCWPAIRAIPRELLEAAALDGLGPVGEFRRVVWPFARGAWGRAAAAVAVLALGEVAAGKLVAPPHRREFVLELFNQMHYGAEATVAAMCLLQVIAVAGCMGLVMLAAGREPGPGNRRPSAGG